MASKNSVKTYIKNSFYHIYNRGVERRSIFLDEQDYSVFLSYLQTYLIPKDMDYLYSVISSEKASIQEKDQAIKLLRLKNYYNQIELICYALMTNHFHLLLKQCELILNNFMNSLGTRYGMYFNRKYKRTGVLFQDVYKAVIVENDEQLLHLSRYIHLNPIEAMNLPPHRWQEAPYPSSLPDFLNIRHTKWIHKNHILNYFSKTNPYNTYENFLGSAVDSLFVANLALDLDLD